MEAMPTGTSARRRRRTPRLRPTARVAALVVAAVVIGIVVGPPLTSPRLRDDAGSTGGCTDVTFYGVRGTGQATDDATRGFGREAASVAELAGEVLRASGRTVSHRSAAYPAASAREDAGYRASVVAGVDSVTSDLVGLVEECPETEVVVLGFSQGAQVAHLALSRPGEPGTTRAEVSAEVLDRVRSVVLIADPLRSLDDPAVSLPDWDGTPTSGGFETTTSAPRIDPSLSGRVLSPCYPSDPVCHADGRPVLGMLTHAFAYEWGPAEDRIADWVVARLADPSPT